MTKKRFYQVLRLLVAMALITGCVTAPGKTDIPETVAEVYPGVLQGYLPADAYPDSLALLPPPPSKGSAAMALD